MRNFLDTMGDEWTVFEVRRQVTGSTSADRAPLPNGFSSGWLCFENATAKRRLVRFPERWRELSDAELEKLLGQAQPAPRAALRLDDDLPGPAAPDARVD